MLSLQVAGGGVDHDRVAGNVVPDVLEWDPAAGTADDHAKLDFPVDLLGHLRPQHDRVTRGEHRLRKLEEDRRPAVSVGAEVGTDLLAVLAVVETDAEHAPAFATQRGQQLGLVDPPAGSGAVGDPAAVGQRPVERLGPRCLHCDETLAVDEADVLSPGCAEPNEAHYPPAF